MPSPPKSKLAEVLRTQSDQLLQEWISEQLKLGRRDQMKESELREQCAEFLRLLQATFESGDAERTDSTQTTELRQMLSNISRSRTKQGFTPTETATFVFSFKGPLFNR